MPSGRPSGLPRPADARRRTVAAAVATVLTSFALYPVYSGGSWWWAGLGATAAVAGAGTLTRLRRLPVAVCLLGGLAGLLLYLNVVFAAGQSLAAVIPTPSSVTALARLVSQGAGEAGRYAPPAPEQPGLLLLAAGGIGLTAVAADLIAARLGRAALAGIPLLLLFAEPFTLSISRGPFGTVVVFGLSAAGYLTLLATDGAERIRAWEGVAGTERVEVSRTGLPTRGLARFRPPDTRALTAAGRRIGVASVVAALCVPLFIPGLHVTRLFGSGRPGIGGNGAGSVLGFPDPRTQISQELRSRQAVPVLTYTTTAEEPGYLQAYVLDALSAGGWGLGGLPRREKATGLRPPGLASPGTAPTVTTRVSVSRQTGPDTLGALPAPYPPVRVTAPGAVRADPGTLMLFDPGTALSGLRYSVTSLDVAPSAPALAAAPPPPVSPAASASSASLQAERAVPRAYDSLRPLASRVTSGASTAYARAVALQHWLSGGTFTYSLAAPAITSAAGLNAFLTRTRTGYCQQFAYAMAVLARLEGIPSRVAYGFTQGTEQPDGRWLVTTHDAHAWPELYFAGYGWLRFEPTPAGSDGQGTAVDPAYAPAPPGSSSASPGTANTPAPDPAATAPGAGNGGRPAPSGGHHPAGPGGSPVTPARPSGGTSPWPAAGLSAAVLLLIAAGLPGLARLVIRRRRWSGAVSDQALAEAAWRELADDLADFGAAGPDSESPRARARRVTASLRLPPDATAALRRIAEAAERARYSARPCDGAPLRRDCRTVRRAVAASVPRRTRWRARGFPPSVLDRAARSRPVMSWPSRLSWLPLSGPKKDRLTLSKRAPVAQRPESDPAGAGTVGRRPLEAASFLTPAPPLLERLHDRGPAAPGAPALLPGAPAARPGRLAPGRRGPGGMPPAGQGPDAAEQDDDESRDGEVVHVQDQAGHDQADADSEARGRVDDPAPVVHAGITGAY